jgi:hypothetical protein
MTTMGEKLTPEEFNEMESILFSLTVPLKTVEKSSLTIPVLF